MTTLTDIANNTLDALRRGSETSTPDLHVEESGTVLSVGRGIARLSGLPDVRSEELVRLP